jgi:hypothetical protein
LGAAVEMFWLTGSTMAVVGILPTARAGSSPVAPSSVGGEDARVSVGVFSVQANPTPHAKASAKALVVCGPRSWIDRLKRRKRSGGMETLQLRGQRSEPEEERRLRGFIFNLSFGTGVRKKSS